MGCSGSRRRRLCKSSVLEVGGVRAGFFLFEKTFKINIFLCDFDSFGDAKEGFPYLHMFGGGAILLYLQKGKALLLLFVVYYRISLCFLVPVLPRLCSIVVLRLPGSHPPKQTTSCISYFNSATSSLLLGLSCYHIDVTTMLPCRKYFCSATNTSIIRIIC